jgi:hypothetical protein
MGYPGKYTQVKQAVREIKWNNQDLTWQSVSGFLSTYDAQLMTFVWI